MSDDDNSPISAREAKQLFAELKSAPALVLAVSGGPDSIALMWLAAARQRGPPRGPRLPLLPPDHRLPGGGARAGGAGEGLAVISLSQHTGHAGRR